MAKKKVKHNIIFIKSEEPTEVVNVEGMTFSPKSVIVTDDAIYKIDMMPNLETVDHLDDGTAYLQGKYYYIYRGIGNIEMLENKKPGIYKNRHSNPRFFIIDPKTDEEKEEYNALNNVSSLHPQSVIDNANSKEDLLIAIPESTRIFQPAITENDDLLKMLAKRVLQEKDVDLDQNKDRFSNKNELFNYKQVLRGDNKLSIRIFDRGMEALNLKYTIIVEERTTNDIVGKPLKEPVSISSEETYAA